MTYIKERKEKIIRCYKKCYKIKHWSETFNFIESNYKPNYKFKNERELVIFLNRLDMGVRKDCF